MTDQERIQWLFIEFLKMQCKADRALAELAELKAGLNINELREHERRARALQCSQLSKRK